MSWINEYHVKTRTIIGTELKKQKKDEALDWLLRATEPITDESW